MSTRCFSPRRSLKHTSAARRFPLAGARTQPADRLHRAASHRRRLRRQPFDSPLNTVLQRSPQPSPPGTRCCASPRRPRCTRRWCHGPRRSGARWLGCRADGDPRMPVMAAAHARGGVRACVVRPHVRLAGRLVGQPTHAVRAGDQHLRALHRSCARCRRVAPDSVVHINETFSSCVDLMPYTGVIPDGIGERTPLCVLEMSE